MSMVTVDAPFNLVGRRDARVARYSRSTRAARKRRGEGRVPRWISVVSFVCVTLVMIVTL